MGMNIDQVAASSLTSSIVTSMLQIYSLLPSLFITSFSLIIKFVTTVVKILRVGKGA